MLSQSLRTARKRGMRARPTYQNESHFRSKRQIGLSIVSQVSGYKERLLKLKLLPLCMYAERHDFLLLISLNRSEDDVEIHNMKRKSG